MRFSERHFALAHKPFILERWRCRSEPKEGEEGGGGGAVSHRRMFANEGLDEKLNFDSELIKRIPF